MIKKVLFVDDDRILCRLIQKKFERYSNIFSVLTAPDGLNAIQQLKEHTISLVVTDLQMPEMDGFALLAYLSEKYPDIPVIVQTGHSTPKSKTSVLKRGAAGYIEKPFKIEALADKIIATLKKESEGGILQTIPLEMFIQLIEMEQKTCTIRVIEKSTGKQGVLFFKDGNLMEARIGSRQGKPAAYEIFAWDQVTLSIQDDCAVKEKKIDEDLQAILFDAMRLKDETDEDETAFEEKTYEDEASFEEVLEDQASFKEEIHAEPVEIEHPKPQAEPVTFEDHLRQKLENIIPDKKFLYDIYPDNTWDDLIIQASEIGRMLEAGALKACYIDRGEPTDFILMPGEKAMVISIDSKCPRDALLEALSR